MILRAAKISTLTLFMQVGGTAQAASNLQPIFEFGVTQANFNDAVVEEKSTNFAWGLAVAYKSNFEFGYTSIIDLAKAIMSYGAGIQSEDGFYAYGSVYYLRGLYALNNTTDIFLLAGRSTITVETTSTIVCLIFCGAAVTTSTTTNYSHKESGLALGFGVVVNTKHNRQLIIQYADYNYGKDFDFKLFILGYRWLFGF